MAWGEIKKALNSRLGTSTFKSLDVLIDEVKAVVDAIKTYTTTNNTASTTGTLSQKISSCINNTAASTTASSSGTLSQKLTYIISTLIGATSATGGSSTAGTVMAKLNKLLKYKRTFTSYSCTSSSQATIVSETASALVTIYNVAVHSLRVEGYIYINDGCMGRISTSKETVYPYLSVLKGSTYILGPGDTFKIEASKGASTETSGILYVTKIEYGV